MKTYLLDASAFIYGMIPGGEIMTPSRVYAEVKDAQSRLKLEVMQGLIVRDPSDAYIASVEAASASTGDDKRISLPDRDLLALAMEEKAAGKEVDILTDDYSVQNVAKKLGISTTALRQKRIKYKVVWEKRCMGCNRIYKEGETCEVCGSPLILKKRSVKR